MKKIIVLLIVVVLLLALSAPVFAFGPGGAPGNHSEEPIAGRAWGGAVAGFATESPVGFAEHIVDGFAGR